MVLCLLAWGGGRWRVVLCLPGRRGWVVVLSPGEEGVAGGTLSPEEVSGGWYSVSTKC